MSDVDEEELYYFKAPSEDSVPTPKDETGAIVGFVIISCVLISCVLLLLWKFIQKKQMEMKLLHLNTQEPDFKIEEAEEENEEKITMEYSNNATKPEKSKINQNIFNKQKTQNHQFQLPHSTLKYGQECDNFKINKFNEVELVLPPISRIPSCSSSHGAEMISSDTGYNSGCYRKDDVGLRRCKKIVPNELNLEKSLEILDFLKDNNQSLRQEREERYIMLKKFKKVLKNCQDAIQRTKKRITFRSEKYLERQDALKEFKELRKRHELLRMRWNKKKTERDKKESFHCVQEWIDGFQLHTSVRQIVEQLFLLRSLHRLEFEQNDVEKEVVRKTLLSAQSCLDDISRTKEKIKKWKSALEQWNYLSDHDENQKFKKAYSTKQRITLPYDLQRNLISVSNCQNNMVENDPNNRCPNCHRYICQCCEKKNTNVSFESFGQVQDKKANGGEKDFSNSTQFEDVSKYEKESDLHAVDKDLSNNFHECSNTRGAHTLILKLREATLQSIQPTSSKTEQLSEREVLKALQRVPYVTGLNSIQKIGKNDWTIVVESNQIKVSNIRFNCKQRSYVIGMFT